MSQLNALSRVYPVPIGTILPVVGNYEQFQDGWIICNGITVRRDIWADLFSVIGTQFGAGDGSTTFNVPNLTGLIPKGASTNGGFNPSSITGTQSYQITEANMPSLGLSTSNWNFATGTLQRDSIIAPISWYNPDGGLESAINKNELDNETNVDVSNTALDVSYSGSGTAQTTPLTGTYTAPSYGMLYLIKGQISLETGAFVPP